MKLLLAEDNATARRMTANLVAKWGYEVVAVENGVQAWEALQSPDRPLIAVLDWVMPGCDGIEVCQRLRQEASEPYVYVLLLTSRDEAEDTVARLEAGADDYVTKPFHPQEFRVRLRAGWRIVQLQQELVAAREILRDKATHDPLTGLWNRGVLEEVMDRELARSRREGIPLAVILADLDHFKRVNDTYGHLAGDAVLRETAHRVRGVLRPYDTALRYGGEELLVIVPGIAKAEAEAMAERLRAALETQPINTSEGPIRATASLGVAWFRDTAGVSAERFVAAADEALYEAKDRGRNRVVLRATQSDEAEGARRPPKRGEARPNVIPAGTRHGGLGTRESQPASSPPPEDA